VLLLGLVVAGALLAALAKDRTLEGRREREEEFVFRAEQYRAAIQSYARAINVNGCSNVQQLPTRLSDLVDDRRCGMVRHHLRRLYSDPIGRSQEWGVVEELGAIRGVYSLSTLPTVRHVDGVKRYSDWRFIAQVEAGDVARTSAAAGGKATDADDRAAGLGCPGSCGGRWR
jgi:type II secretory pathway pseudopilin PulG